MTIQEQENMLIRLVEENTQRECSNLLEEAGRRRKKMIRRAYKQARKHLHQAVKRERTRAISQIRSAEAELHTKRRALEQRKAESLLKESWPLLRTSLSKQWHTEQGRAGWISKCAREALKQIPAQQWIVQHPAECRESELAPFKTILKKESPHTIIETRPASDIEAGLIINAKNTFLDMSLEGLLKDRESIEGRLLALLYRKNQE